MACHQATPSIRRMTPTGPSTPGTLRRPLPFPWHTPGFIRAAILRVRVLWFMASQSVCRQRRQYCACEPASTFPPTSSSAVQPALRLASRFPRFTTEVWCVPAIVPRLTSPLRVRLTAWASAAARSLRHRLHARVGHHLEGPTSHNETPIPYVSQLLLLRACRIARS